MWKVCQRVLWLAAMIVLSSACRRERPPEMLACPGLTIGSWQWVGVVGPPGSVEPFDRIELREDDETLWYGLSYATEDGAFAIRAARRAQGTSRVELHTGSGRHFSITPGRTEALLDHGAEEFAVLEETPGVMQFRGRLSSTPFSTPIEQLWAVNWTTGDVARVTVNPPLDVDFDHARIAGTVGHCMGLFSVHQSGGTGGCWWATPGGCLCRRCEPEEIAAGTCEEPPLPDDLGPSLGCHCEHPPPRVPGEPGASSSGRAPLDARERRDPESAQGGRDRPPPPYRDGVDPSPMPHAPDSGFTPWDPNADAGPEEPPS